MIESLNKILTKNTQYIQGCQMHTKLNLAETLSLLYYYKHGQVMQVFAKSMIDFSTHKNIFTHHIYSIADNTTILKTYFSLFMADSSEIKA